MPGFLYIRLLMQGLAKQSRHIMFTEAHLISFGNFLLTTYGVKVHSTDGKNTPIHQREVSHADFSNWKDAENPDTLLLPSAHQFDDEVFLRLWGDDIIGRILGVHFYPGKVKYDLEVFAGDAQPETEKTEFTRLYNVDSAFVVDKLPQQ